MHVELIRPVEDGELVSARINGAEPIPVLDYALTPAGEGGSLALNLVLPIDSLTVGERPAADVAADCPSLVRPVPVDEQKVTQVWGSPTPDPRESIPGWQPERLGEQVAQNARDAVNRAGQVLA